MYCFETSFSIHNKPIIYTSWLLNHTMSINYAISNFFVMPFQLNSLKNNKNLNKYKKSKNYIN